MSVRRVAAVALALGLVGSGTAADDKKPAEAKAPDFTGWVKYTPPKPFVGEVVKFDDNGLLLKVITGYSGGKPKYEKMQFVLHDAGLVRWKKLPPRTDDKGKRLPYSAKELRTCGRRAAPRGSRPSPPTSSPGT